MKATEILTIFPQKTFTEVFNEREQELLNRGADKGQIESKRNQFEKLFQFDNALQDLKSLFQVEKDLEISIYHHQRITFFIGHVNNFVPWLNQINTGIAHDIATVFQVFEQNINGSGYNSQTQTNKTVIEDYIEELNGVFVFYKLRSFSNDDIEKIKKDAISFAENKKVFDEALVVAKEFIKAKEKHAELSLAEKHEIFEIKAKEHSTDKIPFLIFNKKMPFIKWRPSFKGPVKWLFFGLISAFIAATLAYFFAREIGVDDKYNVGMALLRITILLAPSYFTYFFIQQFNNEKKLYEFYKFKAIAIKTMEDLYKTYDEKQFILDKALSVVFMEPKNGENKLDESFFKEILLGVLKK